MFQSLKQFQSSTYSTFYKSLFLAPIQTFSTLEKYDVVVIGSNIGSVLARHFLHLSQKKHNVYVVSGGSRLLEQHHLRNSYELGYCSQDDYLFPAQTALETTTAHSDGVKVRNIDTQAKVVELINGKQLNYQKLVIALGLQNDSDGIPGIKKAVVDHSHPAFSNSWWQWHDVGLKSAVYSHCKEPIKWYQYSSKEMTKIQVFSIVFHLLEGQMFFYIPEFPFRGEISDFNFLIAYDSWIKNQQQQSSTSNIKLTIVNANSRFCSKSDAAEEMIQNEIKKRGIEVVYNTKLKAVDKAKNEIEIQTGEDAPVIKKYDALYAIVPTHPHEFLLKANLCNEKGLVSVNQGTLQVNNHPDIYCLGELATLPITSGFYSFSLQLNVVRHNLIKTLKGQNPDSIYKMESKSTIYLGQNQLAFLEENYVNGKNLQKVNDKESKQKEYLNFQYYNKLYPKINSAFYKFKHWGSPHHFKPQTF